MQMILYVALVVAALLIGLFLWGVVRIRKGYAQAAAAIQKVRIEDVAGLVTDGQEGLRRAYGITIDLTARETAAKILDELFVNQGKLKRAFARDEFYWRFVLPVGALVGEFIRIHAKGVWKESPDGPLMEIPIKDGVATCYPFNKALKQSDSGEKRDLYAFLISSTQLSSLENLAEPGI